MNDLDGFIPNEESEFPQEYKPLEDRILPLVVDVPFWNFKYIQGKIPQEHEKNIYRAIRKLEQQGKIRFVGYQGRSKVYTTKGISKLPVFVNETGARIGMKDYIDMLPKLYKDGRWVKLADVNELPVTIAQFFIVAQQDDPREMYSVLVERLLGIKTTLSTLLQWCEMLINHPMTNGDMKLFKKLLTGTDAPDVKDLNELKLWLNDYNRTKNETAAEPSAPTPGA